MRHLLILVLSAIPCLGWCESDERASIVIDYPIAAKDMTRDLEPAQFADARGVDYSGLLKRAMGKDAKALASFLIQTSKLQFDGAYGELHSMILLHLLLRWGDVDFAHAILGLDSGTRAYLSREFRHQKRFALSFPDTASNLGIHE